MMNRHVRPTMVLGVRDHIAFEAETADGDGPIDRALVDRAQFRTIERAGLADAKRVDLGFGIHALRTVSAIHWRITPSAPSPS